MGILIYATISFYVFVLNASFLISHHTKHLSLDLLLDDVLEGNGVSSELADAFPELLNGHLVLVEVEAESGLVVDVGLLLEVKRAGGAGVKLLRDSILRVEQLLKEIGLLMQ